ncbi:MAG: hypothetical protein HFH59_10480 [Lachnospiraceae bacterium]|jgi:hypothetical protein|nr:hypothetical protein [Lachnospiraceae bacterium]MCI9099265.1 hypothetical protein [Lachnospiraceae bacterium]MCI9357948.1 hypothetical protein [Lachnospiraceae bacterium]
MSLLQEQAVQMIHGLSDDNVRFLIEIIQRLMIQESRMVVEQQADGQSGIQAFERLNAAREEIRKALPEDFDPDRELEEARAERYESID